MSAAATPDGAWTSGKGGADENFPVASRLVAARHRPAILAFYRFARAADDAADHPTLPPGDKLAILDAMAATLAGDAAVPDALPLARTLAERRLDRRHADDLLTAFRQDVTVRRTATWGDLLHYCSLSAMPVGRFVLDVHGEPRKTWARSDALCAALQTVNHLQDCGADARQLDRVYIPQETLARHGATAGDLLRDRATPAVRSVVADVAGRARILLAQSAGLAREVRDRRLAVEIAAIQRLAETLAHRLATADPLAGEGRLPRGAKALALFAALGEGARRLAHGGPR